MSNENSEGQSYVYANESFSGCDMVATILMPDVGGGSIVYAIGEMQTISYSIHMDRRPVRSIGNINAKDYVMGPRTIAGSLVFAVFNKHFANKIMKDVGDVIKPGYSFLIDELPPFDIIVSAANEYGLRSRLVIYGVRLVNEGQVMSINDVYTENTYQFVATDLEYLTDENQYVSGSSKRKGLYKIIDKDLGSFNNPHIINFKPPVKPKSEDVELKYKVKSIASSEKKGIVDFWLNPVKRKGWLSINNKNTNESLNINVADNVNGNNRVAVQLSAGEYSAVWSNNDIKSNTVNFRVLEDRIVINTERPAPLIEAISDNYIKVYSNCREHTKVLYEDEDKNLYTVKLHGRKATINKLTPDTTYIICTCTDNMEITSEKSKAKTLEYGHDRYMDFLNYIFYNRKSFEYSDMKIYSKIVADAKKISASGIRYETITDTFVEAHRIYNEELGNLKPVDFPNAIEYEKELERLTILSNASAELITALVTISNDELYGYNYETIVVDPPSLEFENGCTNNFMINKNISSMDFFRQFAKTSQFDKNIDKKNFYEKDTYNLCRFNGRPATRHYTYAINNYGFRSSRVDFYVKSNELRSVDLEKMNINNKDIAHKIAYLKSEIGHKIDQRLSEKEITRVLTEAIKSESLKSVKAPTVIEYGDHCIKLLIEDNVSLLKESGAMVVISSIDEALLNKPKYKIPVNNIIEFNSKNNGIRKNNNYAIWIEDNDCNQISECITVKAYTSNETDNELLVKEYFIDNMSSRLMSDISNNSNKAILDRIIQTTKTDIDTNKVEFYKSILDKIIENTPVINNIYELLYQFFKTSHNETYTISNNLFSNNPVLHSNKITVEEDCTAEVIEINNSHIDVRYINLSAGESIEDLGLDKYIMINFIKDNLKGRSGFVLLNRYNGKSITNNLKMKVGE